MIRIKKTIPALVIIFFLVNSVSIPQHNTIRTYTIDEGLSSNVTMDATQDINGRMWFATEVGVSLYDGTYWKNFGDKDGLANGYYAKIKMDEQGTIWAMPQFPKYRIHYFKENKWFSIPTYDFKRKDELLNCIEIKIEKNKPVVLLGTDKSVYLYKDKKWFDLGSIHKMLIGNTSSIVRVEQKFYVTKSNGMFVTDGYSIDDSFNYQTASKNKMILASAYDNSDGISKIWLLGRDWIGYYDIDIKKFVPFYSKFYLKQFPAFSRNYIVPDKINKLWFGNIRENYSLEISTKNLTSLGMKNGFTNDGCSNIFVDNEKNIWFTSPRGIDKLTNSIFTNYDTRDGLLENEVSSIEEIRPGEYFFGHNHSFTILKDNKFYNYDHSNRIPLDFSSGRVMDVCKDKESNLYFAATYAGLGKLDKNGKVTWLLNSNNGKIGYSAVQFDKQGVLWVGSLNGLYKYQNGNLKEVTKLDGRFDMIRQIYFSGNGNQYITASSGIYIVKNNKIISATNSGYPGNTFAVHDYKDGSLLVGMNNGVYTLKNKKIEKFNFGSATVNNKVFFIEQDKNGNYWFGTDDGVFWWDGKTLRKFSMENGLSGRETNRFAWLNDSMNRVWIGTDRGLSCYKKEYDINTSIPKTPVAVLIDFHGQEHRLKQMVEFPNSENTFSISTNAVSFIDENRIIYRVKLSGFDKDWLEIGNSNTTRYTNLPAGEYRLHIQAKNANGEWSQPFISESIIISKPFYVTWWFAILVSLGTISGLIVANSYFSQRKYSAQLETEVKVRTDLLFASEQKMKAIIENSPTLIVTFNREGKILFVNRDSKYVKREQIMDKSLFDFFPKEFHERLNESINQIFSNQKTIFFPHLFNQFPQPTYFESYVSPVIHSDGTVKEAVIIAVDQTEKIKSEQEKKNIEEKQNAILDALPIVLYNDTNIKDEPASWISESVQKITGYSNEDFYSKKITWREKIHPDDFDKVMEVFDNVKIDQPITIEYRFLTADGKYKWLLDIISPIKKLNSGKIEFFGIWFDIDEQKHAKYRLELLNEYFLKFGTNPNENINKIVQLCGIELNATFAFYNCMQNGELTTLGSWGTPEDFSIDSSNGRQVCYDVITSPQAEIVYYEDLAKTKYAQTDPLINNFGIKTYVGFPVKHGDKTLGTLSVVYNRTEKPSENDYKFMNILGAAISVEEERKLAMHLLSESVKEKEVLLREVYHRVKNNLQVISSLLYLQSLNIKDKSLLAMFSESQNRVQSMALVHESLYNSNNLSEINLGEYVEKLAAQLRSSFSVDCNLNVISESSKLFLNIEKAIPCGLILNELLTNSFKYAQPALKETKLEIAVRLSREDEKVKLIYRDNGKGLPDNVKLSGSNKTLGVNLIYKLTNQIDGQVEYEFDDGAKFTIDFPI